MKRLDSPIIQQYRGHSHELKTEGPIFLRAEELKTLRFLDVYNQSWISMEGCPSETSLSRLVCQKGGQTMRASLKKKRDRVLAW